MNDFDRLAISPEFRPFLSNLNERARQPDRMPFIGRRTELEAVMETLLRKLRNNLILVGKPGVGKTALITELASLINRGQVPTFLKDKIILELSVNTFVYSKDSAELLIMDFEKFFSEIRNNRERVILFLDEMQLQTFAGADKQSQYVHFKGLLKTHIANREFTVIAATTPEYYYQVVQNDDVLSSYISAVLVNEPEQKEMLEVLEGVRGYFERYYSLKIPAPLFAEIYTLAQRFIPHRAFPDKAIELLDISCSKASVKKERRLAPAHVYQSVSAISRLDIEIVRKDPQQHVRGLTDHLRRSLVNQESALEEIARIIKISTLKMDAATRRPEVIFLFLGPAGIGKSYVAARIAEYLFGSPEKLRVIDLGGFKSGADVQKLIAGEEAGSQGVLVREVENHPFSVILLENAGEAHALVLNFLSKILTRGEIVDPFGKPHFLSGIIFILSLTSIGEQKREPTIGFEKSGDTATALVIPQKIMNVLDWVDEIIQFVPLTRAHLLQIAKQRAAALKQELLSRHQCQLRVEKAVLETLSLEAERSGRYAHAVSELVERKIKMPVMDLIAGGGRRLRIAVEWKSNQIRVRSK